MLFSIFLSYYLARKVDGKTYRLLVALSMIGMSFLWAYLNAFGLIFWVFPLPMHLSFPFYLTADYEWSEAWHVTSYKISLFSLETICIQPQNIIMYGFLFSLLVNSFGAIIGYWINKKLVWGSLEEKMFEIFSEGTILLCIIGPLLSPVLILIPILGVFVHYLFILFWVSPLFWVPAAAIAITYGIRESI